jgi:hypothetical protein
MHIRVSTVGCYGAIPEHAVKEPYLAYLCGKEWTVEEKQKNVQL